MLSKETRSKQQRAHVSLVHAKRILKEMERYLNSYDPKKIELAEAFLQVFRYHVECGDLEPENVHMASLLRCKVEDKKQTKGV